MEENKSSLYPVIGGGVFALLGAVNIMIIIQNIMSIIQYGVSPFTAITTLVYFVIAFAMFTKRRDILLPICFSVLTFLNLFSFGGGMPYLISALLFLLSTGGLAIICFGEFTNYLKDHYKEGSKKLWYVPALIHIIGAIVEWLIGFISWDLSVYNIFPNIIETVGYGLVGMWAVYPNGAPKKVYNVISNENVGIGIDVNTENIINSIYECFCENVKRGLKTPATAVFCKPEELQIKELDGIYTVSGWVDSQNSYGAMIRTPFTLKMKNENGKIISTTNVNMLGAKRFAANYFTYLIFGIIITAILFAISYFFISGMF